MILIELVEIGLSPFPKEIWENVPDFHFKD